jgi:hypothetical protein
MAHEIQTTIAVIGAGDCDADAADTARELGRLLAVEGYTLICGGRGGIMAAASQGATEAGGQTIGVLPGLSRQDANASITIPLATGLGHMRNYLVVLNADAVVALDGEWGTLSEIALAKKIGRQVVGMGRWQELEGLIPARTPAEAVAAVQNCLANRLAK